MKSGITIRSGAEGPRHDPYHYDEITVTNARGKFTYHGGLGSWCEANAFGRKWRVDGDKPAWETFVHHTGMTPYIAQVVVRRHENKTLTRKFREHKSRCNGQIGWFDGYPGESLCGCNKCGSIFDSHFNRSAIE